MAKREYWTAIIPCAGKGSRLGYSAPNHKIMLDVAGKPVLDWIVALLKPYVSGFIFVVNGDGGVGLPILGRFSVEDLDAYDVRFVVQTEQDGTYSAVKQGAAKVRTPQTLVLWGDCPCILPATVERAMERHTEITMPVAWVEHPSTFVGRRGDHRSSPIGIFESAEGQPIPERGETDLGMFLVTTSVLQAELWARVPVGPLSRERSFLTVLHRMMHHYRVETVEATDPQEAIGIDTPEDLARAEAWLGWLGPN